IRAAVPAGHGPLPRRGAPRLPGGAGTDQRLLASRHRMSAPAATAPLLEAAGLTKHFAVRRGLLGWGTGTVRAVDNVAFRIDPATTLGLVGESGCGKNNTSQLVLALE